MTTQETENQVGGALPGSGNVYEGGQADARVSDAPVSRFRPTYRKLDEKEIELHNSIKAKAAELEELMNQVGPGRYTSLALTALEESVIWSVKQLTS